MVFGAEHSPESAAPGAPVVVVVDPLLRLRARTRVGTESSRPTGARQNGREVR